MPNFGPLVGDPWRSDPEAIEAQRHLTYLPGRLAGPDSPRAVEVRCAAEKDGRGCGNLLAFVHDTTKGWVLTLYHWPDGESRTAANRLATVVFLEEAGEWARYSCWEHGSWPADLRKARETAEEGLVVGHPKMTLPSMPSG